MMSELQPIIRIGLYILSGYLLNAGLPPEVAAVVAHDPAIAELLSQIIAGAVAVVALIWWRIARRWGMAT